MNFDWQKPTVEMLGRWQPWHDGHQELFKHCYAITGQVVIMVRDVPKDKEANERVPGQDDNPFDFEAVCKNIDNGLKHIQDFTEIYFDEHGLDHLRRMNQ